MYQIQLGELKWLFWASKIVSIILICKYAPLSSQLSRSCSCDTKTSYGVLLIKLLIHTGPMTIVEFISESISYHSQPTCFGKAHTEKIGAALPASNCCLEASMTSCPIQAPLKYSLSILCSSQHQVNRMSRRTSYKRTRKEGTKTFAICKKLWWPAKFVPFWVPYRQKLQSHRFHYYKSRTFSC